MQENQSSHNSRLIPSYSCILSNSRMEIEECHPLVSFNEIKNWNPPSEAPPRKRTSLKKLETKSRTIVCHDMRGGYLEDRFVAGSTNHKSYAFWHWSMVDIFVYFSHKLLTIPPPGWIEAAHLHGVLILGTFITEWEGGTSICEEIFTKDEHIDLLANKMSLVAAHHNFDGYLINIENKLSEVALQGMIHFLKKLQTQLKMIKEENLLIWYDSVTINGELLWQNELNAKNYPFFEVSDGIFLNYTWKRENIEASVAAAGIRSFDVYVGIDIFGRGTYGGGGWETWQAVNVIRQHPLSVALFAPGWVYESFEEDYHNMQDKFWNFLRPHLHTNKRKLEFPIETSFCRGFGLYRRKFGKKVEGIYGFP
ncbi:uncharacterized protein LOC136039920 [Artemia franciscana]|uniref:uncharacterized protein LOC136039920 n=1 Tax=Artemia franciscana TaxID=6661 RepID=UPI0032DA85C2